ncbi:MAG: hypothetical protein IT195_07555 [Microthrixaceae bacterium]|nr:hypothetical protein [Microthrixaceae bacterium]
MGTEGTDQTAREWATANLELLWKMSRWTRVASAQLDGALTAGQSTSGGDTRVGFSLKYEVKDGLLDELVDLIVAAQENGASTGPVADVARVTWDAHHLISNNLRLAVRAQYQDSGMTEKARFALRDVADAIDSLLLDLLHSRVEH